MIEHIFFYNLQSFLERAGKTFHQAQVFVIPRFRQMRRVLSVQILDFTTNHFLHFTIENFDSVNASMAHFQFIDGYAIGVGLAHPIQ